MSRRRTTNKLRSMIAAAAAAMTAVVVGALAAAPPASAATLQEVTNFGSNPSGTRMFLYVPASVKPNPAVVVGVHWCHGTAQDFYGGTGYASLADRHGFVVIYPSAPSSDGCWDVHSSASLSHNGGGDSLGIVSMVNYVKQRYAADPNRIFVTGHSSGGMMTNVLLGAYPDVFRAGSAYAGVPFGCFAGANSWNTACANGQVSRSTQQWGDTVRAAYPGYSGARPRMQLWHGTNDDTLRFANFGEEIKQWTNVHGVSQTPTSTEQNQPRSGWVRTRYGSNVEAIQETGQPHNLQILADETIHFFGLDASTTSPPPATGTAPNGFPYCGSAGSDPDGDGWGWENNRSCVVRAGRADGAAPSPAATAPNGYPYCASAGSDPDGDGWGWESNRSCVVRGSQADH